MHAAAAAAEQQQQPEEVAVVPHLQLKMAVRWGEFTVDVSESLVAVATSLLRRRSREGRCFCKYN